LARCRRAWGFREAKAGDRDDTRWGIDASMASLRRELQRNGQLRERCGFNPLLGIRAVPSKDAYHRFLKNLLSMQKQVDKIFDELIEELRRLLPDLGKRLAIDSKRIDTYARDHRDQKLKGEKGTSKEIITRSLYPDRVDNIVYGYKGGLYCHCPV
jgi:hypothetical protein